ncbi:MAG: hypothetical protein DI628_00020 [Blastochloris viridis]|uniref:Uncharacterized protein n=1 Tax=Blastochloris viridis TaxID=1079 RepID=A0A6N4RD46_BLAVI|nr:MAG: hypothetical protein DI628_00020 [Blastochloris viridis]
MTAANKVQKEESEIISLLQFAKSGPFTEGELSELYTGIKQRTHPRLEVVVADHMGAFCRAPIKGKCRKAFTREEIDRDYPYMDEIRRRLPHANLLDRVSDDVFRAAALVGGMLVAGGLVEGSSDYIECVMTWRELLFPELKAVG